MKKAYIAPSTTLSEVKTGNMLALSTGANATITTDNKDQFEVYSGRAHESIWSANSAKSGIRKLPPAPLAHNPQGAARNLALRRSPFSFLGRSFYTATRTIYTTRKVVCIVVLWFYRRRRTGPTPFLCRRSAMQIDMVQKLLHTCPKT